MPPTKHLLLSALAAMAALACDPAFRLRGSVKDASGAPVRAHIRVLCDDQVFTEAATNAEGAFLQHRFGWCPETCVLEVAAEGAPPQRYPIMKYCVDEPDQVRGDACLDVAAEVQVLSETPAPSVQGQ